MLEFVAIVVWPIACGLMAGVPAFFAFKAFEKYLEHREKKFVHAPLAEMQRKLDELESKLLNAAMRGR